MTKEQARIKAREVASLWGAELLTIRVVDGKYVGYFQEHGEKFNSELGEAEDQIKVGFRIVKQHIIHQDNNNISSLEQAKLPDLQKFIDNCLRQKSPKTGKQIKINVYGWRKGDVITLIRNAGFEKQAIEWLNKNVYYNLTVYQVDELAPVNA